MAPSSRACAPRTRCRRCCGPKLTDCGAMSAPGHTALGAWSGGRYMHFGEQLDEDRLVRLLRPDAAIDTVVTADVYGAGEADLGGRPRARRPAARIVLARRGGRPRLLRHPARRLQGLPALHFAAELRGEDVRGLPPPGRRAQPRALRGRSLRRAPACTTPTASATPRRPSGRPWPGCARRACAARSASRPGPRTASRSTSSAVSSASAT